MSNILDIFYGNQQSKNETAIRTCNIADKVSHKIGIGHIANHLCDDFKFTNEVKIVFSKLFDYFTGDEHACFSHGISLNKGLFVVGDVGVGKSILMQIYRLYTSEILQCNSFKYYNSQNIIDNVASKGADFLNQFSENESSPIVMYIDDICSKSEQVNNFGNKMNAIESLLDYRYRVFQKYKKLTHVSSNLYPSQMSNYYDARIIDRMSEMFNVIEFNGKSFRK